jgi:hypothetical protein
MDESRQGERRSRGELLRDVQEFMSTRDIESAEACAQRLLATFPPGRRLPENVVLVAYGGGKDSSYMVTFVRLMQLLIDRDCHETFRIRTVTNWHPGMPGAVLSNIDRAYRALGLYEDPDCELLFVNGTSLSPFSADAAGAPQMVERVRLDMLMTGHRTGADARPTFCNTCNLGMVNAFGLAARHNGGVDVIITGDSADEQRAYFRWVARVASRIGTAGTAQRNGAFANFLVATNGIAEAYFGDIYGPGAVDVTSERGIVTDVPPHLSFFSIYDDTAYASGEHWDLLTRFLGFEFDDIAFSFTESDCGNPALMAHLRGLKCERIYHRSYAEGISEYVDFAVSLMRQKHFPEFLIAKAQARYATPDAIERMRGLMVGYCSAAFGVNEEQLLCMVYAPFSGQAAGLQRYVAEVQPQLADRRDEIVALLAADAHDPSAHETAALTAALERMSGLQLRYLRRLYASPVRHADVGPAHPHGDVIGAILDGDPHKALIKTRHSPTGPYVEEQISGR